MNRLVETLVEQGKPIRRAKESNPEAAISYKAALGRALCDVMEENAKTFILGQDVGRFSIGGITTGLIDSFGAARVRDCPISESAMIGMAVGAAMNGYTVVVELAYADIAAVAFSSIVHAAAKIPYATNGQLRCPLIVRSPVNRFSRHGPMGTEVTASWFYNVPDIDIAMPADSHEAYWLLRHAFERPVPTIFLEDRSLNATVGVIGERAEILSRPRVLRPGSDVTVIGAGRMATLALQAAEALATARRGIDVRVVSLGTVKPLDIDTVRTESLATRRVLIVQEEPRFGGYGPVIQSILAELPLGTLKQPPALLARPNTFLPYNREEDLLPSANAIADGVRALLFGKDEIG